MEPAWPNRPRRSRPERIDATSVLATGLAVQFAGIGRIASALMVTRRIEAALTTVAASHIDAGVLHAVSLERWHAAL